LVELAAGPIGAAMHPRTSELLRHLDGHRAVLQQALDAVPPGLREWMPAPDRWSVAEVLEHLGIVERRVAKMLGDGILAAQRDGPLPPDPDHAAILPTIDAQQVLDRERAFMAREAVQPRSGATAAEAWDRLQQSRQALRGVLMAADGLRTDSIRVPHPFLGELTFHQWIAFVGLHESRHAAQIRATIAGLQSDAGPGPQA
jgi:hypothetical protein